MYLHFVIINSVLLNLATWAGVQAGSLASVPKLAI